MAKFKLIILYLIIMAIYKSISIFLFCAQNFYFHRFEMFITIQFLHYLILDYDFLYFVNYLSFDQ